MKKILFLSLLLFSACAKNEEPAPCVICNVNVKYWTATSGNQFYVESSTKYCDDSWKAINGKVEIRSGTNNSVPFKKTSTTTCQ